MVAPPSIRGAGAPGQPGAQKREPTDLRSPNPRSTRGPSATVGPAPKKTRGNGDGHGRLRYTERSGRVAAFRTASHRESGATQTFLTYSPRLHATSYRCDGRNPLRACEDLASESMGGCCQEEPRPAERRGSAIRRRTSDETNRCRALARSRARWTFYPACRTTSERAQSAFGAVSRSTRAGSQGGGKSACLIPNGILLTQIDRNLRRAPRGADCYSGMPERGSEYEICVWDR